MQYSSRKLTISVALPALALFTIAFTHGLCISAIMDPRDVCAPIGLLNSRPVAAAPLNSLDQLSSSPHHHRPLLLLLKKKSARGGMQAKDNASVGRTASILRSNKSTTSRNQSLIKKQIAPNDTHPSDILVERFQGWKAIVKQLIAYFEVT